MNSPELFLISVLRVLVEVAGYALLGQGVLAIFAGKNRDQNAIYRLMQTVARPAVKTVRMLAPRALIDRHIPILTFFVLFWLWIGLAVAKRYICISQGIKCVA